MLKDVHILPGYETPTNDIAEEFYNPVLLQSVSYDRIAGYFSSRSLAYFSKGIESLALNHGHYRLIISDQISQEDYNAMIDGYERREIITNLVKNVEEVIPFQSENRDFSNLAYLISIGVVDIKIGFTTDGLFHAKYGIMTDSKNNSVYFSGSFNETENAFAHNYENIDVKKSWTDIETNDYINSYKETFDNLWNGKNRDGMLFVKEINDIVKKEIVKYNKGKLIMEEELLTPNSLVLYLAQNQLYIEDNLETSLESISKVPRKLRRIKQDYLENGKLWDFRKNIGYKEIQDGVIPSFKALAKKKHFNFVVAESVLKYIKNSKFEIDKLSLQGTNIKNKDVFYKPYLQEFEKIVNKEISRKLRPAQLWVSFYMAMMQRVGNFSVPGAGKTAMVYGTFAYLSSPKKQKIDKLVVIGPKSSFLAWKDEFHVVFGSHRKLRVLDVQNPEFREEDMYKNTNQYNLILVNYESLQKYENPLSHIIDRKTLLVFDEVHKLKGIAAERPKYAQPLANLANYKLALTGTPIPNGYVDIYNMLNLLYKDEYRDYFGFTVSELQNADILLADEINEKLNPFFWRVTKEDLEVPPAEPDHIESIVASPEEQKVINILWRKYGYQPFKLYIRLIQMASNPDLLKSAVNKAMFTNIGGDQDENGKSLVFEYDDAMYDEPDYSAEELEAIDSLTTSSKFEKAVEKAVELISKQHKPVVWAIFIDTIDKFSAEIERKGYKVAKIYGSVPPVEREKLIQGFQNGEFDLLISNPHTLAESVSLHKVSHDAIYLEYSFNLTHMLQSRDRIHRLGLKPGTKTNYYYFELIGMQGQRQPIDKTIYERLEEKRDLMLEAIEGTRLTPEFTESEKNEVEDLMHDFMKEA